MKRSFKQGMVTFLVFAVAACSGNKNQKPPQAATPPGAQSLQNLVALSQHAQQACCQSAAPYMVAVGKSMYSPTPGSMAPIQQPNMSVCQQAVMNFELEFRSIDNGQYANRPDAQAWRQSQGAGVVNCVGDQLQAAGLPVNAATMPMYFAAGQALARGVQANVPTILIPNTMPGQNGSAGGTAPSFTPAGVASNPFVSGNNGYAVGYGYGTNPQLGANPHAAGSTTGSSAATTIGANTISYTSPTLASTIGAPNFFSANAANEIFTTLPNIPSGY